MAKKLTFVEPLLNKIKATVMEGDKDCLEKSLTLFGSDSDMEELSKSILDEYRKDENKFVLVDFSPLMSLGTHTRLHALEKLYTQVPFIVVAKKGIVFEQLKSFKEFTIILCDEDGKVSSLEFNGGWAQRLGRLVSKQIEKGQNIFTIHGEWVERTLLEIIPNSIRKPPAETRYLQLHDGAWANLWIDVKSIVKEPERAFFIGYQMGYLLTKGYSERITEEGFVTANNTAYLLASFLHQVFDKKDLVMIDRLGPYPNLSKTRLLGLERIEGKKLCMVEDVISTGRECDMTYLIVYLEKAEITRIVSLFNLEIAVSRLIPEENILSLCNPSQNIGYKRYPKYTRKN